MLLCLGFVLSKLRKPLLPKSRLRTRMIFRITQVGVEQTLNWVSLPLPSSVYVRVWGQFCLSQPRRGRGQACCQNPIKLRTDPQQSSVSAVPGSGVLDKHKAGGQAARLRSYLHLKVCVILSESILHLLVGWFCDKLNEEEIIIIIQRDEMVHACEGRAVPGKCFVFTWEVKK